jgi:hypothetical protein
MITLAFYLQVQDLAGKVAREKLGVDFLVGLGLFLCGVVES